jgi:hypothetical protein
LIHLHLGTFIDALSGEPALKEKLFLNDHGSLAQLIATTVRIENFLEWEKSNRRQLRLHHRLHTSGDGELALSSLSHLQH